MFLSSPQAPMALTNEKMLNSSNNGANKRKRTKQTLAGPRRLLHQESSTTGDVNRLVWVLVGKTEHQAWLLEDLDGKDTVLIRWESTRNEERVPALSIRKDLPGRSSRRKQAQVFRYDEHFEIENETTKEPRRKKPRVSSQGGRKRKASKAESFASKPDHTNTTPLQANFLPEQKVEIRERSVSNQKDKGVTMNDKNRNIDSSAKVSQNKRGSDQYRRLPIHDSELIDDMTLVSRLMSILSRLDDPPENSDDDDDDGTLKFSLPQRKPFSISDIRQREANGSVFDEDESYMVYPMTRGALDSICEIFQEEVRKTLYMYEKENSDHTEPAQLLCIDEP